MQRAISQKSQISYKNTFNLDQDVDLGFKHLVLTNKNISQKQKLINAKGKIFTAQLSKNKRFITTGSTNKCKLDIWSNKCAKMIKTIKFKSHVIQSIFSLNDECIYVAFRKQLILISIVRGFKQFDCCSINKSDHPGQYIRQIVEIKEKIIIISHGSRIYKFDCFNNQLTNILSLGKQIYSFDYDYEQQALVCSSNSQQQLSLLINQKLLIEQRIEYIGQIKKENLFGDANRIDELKFFNNSHILGSMTRDLIIWYIDYDKKEFIRKLYIQNSSFMMYFSLDFSPRYIIMFCNKFIYAYELKNENQNQFIDHKELSLLQCIQIKSKFNHFQQEPYIIYGLK